VCTGDVLHGRGGAGSGDEGCRAWAALLGAYKAERTLGEGSFGKVKHARRDRGAPPRQGHPRRHRLRAQLQARLRLGARAPRAHRRRRAPRPRRLRLSPSVASSSSETHLSVTSRTGGAPVSLLLDQHEWSSPQQVRRLRRPPKASLAGHPHPAPHPSTCP
jgi:hypothetical protein